MGKSLFITEKPSVARDFAKALGVSGSQGSGYVENDDYVITWCVGHLVTMCNPDEYGEEYKKWDIDMLPMIPDTYLYAPIPDTKKQYKIVAGLLNRKDIDKIYYSGDSAREGEYIQRLVRQIAGHNKNAKEYRVWIDSQTDEEIKRGIREAKPLSYYDSLSDSAYARAIEDWLVGMNFSRALSIKYGKIANLSSPDSKYHPVAVGRVMSCVLGMVVDREREIRNTTVYPVYGINASFQNGIQASWKIVSPSDYVDDPDNYNNTGLLNKDKADKLVSVLNGNGTLTVKENKRTVSKKEAPLLFNLAELQAECSKKLKIGPSKTLEIAQELYEKKMTTYPRTDARVLTTAITKVIDQNIRGLTGDPEIGRFASDILQNGMTQKIKGGKTKYVDDSKVSDHYALIPTGQNAQLAGSLNPDSREVYYMICRRFLSIFYPAAEYAKQSAVFMQNKETFTSSASCCTNPGFLAVTGMNDAEDESSLNALAAMQGTLPASFSIKEGKTKIPSRYTTGSMILAMENAGKLIEDEQLRETIKGSGIGTSATRAAVIEKLKADRYIAVASTQVITPTKFGEVIYEILKAAIPTILNPVYTASWEKGLQMIVDKQVSKETYLAKIDNYIKGSVNEMKSKDETEAIKQKKADLDKVYGPDKKKSTGAEDTEYKCPFCGRTLKSSSKVKMYYCPGFSDKSCSFNLPLTMKIGSTITNIPAYAVHEMMSSLAKQTDGSFKSDPTSKPISGFVSKAGKSFKAKIHLEISADHRARYVFDFEPRK